MYQLLQKWFPFFVYIFCIHFPNFLQPYLLAVSGHINNCLVTLPVIKSPSVGNISSLLWSFINITLWVASVCSFVVFPFVFSCSACLFFFFFACLFFILPNDAPWTSAGLSASLLSLRYECYNANTFTLNVIFVSMQISHC